MHYQYYQLNYFFLLWFLIVDARKEIFPKFAKNQTKVLTILFFPKDFLTTLYIYTYPSFAQVRLEDITS